MSVNSVAAEWRDSLRVNRNCFRQFYSRPNRPDWLHQALQMIEQQAFSPGNDVLEFLNGVSVGDQMTKCFYLYQYKPSVGLYPDTDINPELCVGVLL